MILGLGGALSFVVSEGLDTASQVSSGTAVQGTVPQSLYSSSKVFGQEKCG